MNKKYQIGQKYLLKVFMEAEEMEYLGEVKTAQLNGSQVDIRFEAFRRYSFGQPDLFAIYNGEFFTRTYDNTVEGLAKAVGNTFRFEGKGYTYISVDGIRLTVEEFKSQVKNLLTEEEASETISLGRYFVRNKNYGEIKWCPRCKKIRQTTCAACGCGSCKICEYRWSCHPSSPITYSIKPNSSTELRSRIQSYLGNGGLFNPEFMEHDKVRDLILDFREYLDQTQPPTQ